MVFGEVIPTRIHWVHGDDATVLLIQILGPILEWGTPRYPPMEVTPGKIPCRCMDDDLDGTTMYHCFFGNLLI